MKVFRIPGLTLLLLQHPARRMARALLVLACLVGAVTCAAGDARRPNVLFIAVDDLNTRIGCYGDPVARTPNLDRLALRGVKFDRAYCQFPLCNPSRVSLMLGRYPTTTDTIDFARPALLERDWVTLTEHFRASGYEVRLRGKSTTTRSRNRGRRQEAVRKEQESPPPNDGRPDPLGAIPNTGAPALMGQDAADLGQRIRPGPESEKDRRGARAKDYEWTADVKNTKQAIELLTVGPRARPFFLGLGFYKPHVPLVAPQRFFDLYPPEKMPLPRGLRSHAHRRRLGARATRCVTTWICSTRNVPTPERARAAIAAYYACISFMDEKLGRCSDALDRLGLRDNTVIVLWGDHGWHLGEKGMWAKGTLFDVSAHAPLMIVDPRLKTAGQACPRTVEFVDIYPTLVDCAAWPCRRASKGAAWSALLNNPTAAWNKPALQPGGAGKLAGAFRSHRALVLHGVGRRPLRHELYDHQTDPHELKNLAADPQYAATVAELREKLHKSSIRLRSKAAGFPK